MPYTNDSKPTTSYDDGVAYLLKEDTFHLLLETGGKIVLEESFNDKPLPHYSEEAKGSGSYTNDSKV